MDNRIRFGVGGNASPQLKAYYSEVKDSGKGKAISTIWKFDTTHILWNNTNSNTSATKHQHDLFVGGIFTNPKSEELIQRILELSTSKDDIVLDFFMWFRVIIVIKANSYVNIRSSRLLPKFKTRKINSWCAA